MVPWCPLGPVKSIPAAGAGPRLTSRASPANLSARPIGVPRPGLMADLDENDLRDVLLVRAFEDGGEAALLEAPVATGATAAARAELGRAGEVGAPALIVERARRLRQVLEEQRPAARRAVQLARGRSLPLGLWLPGAVLLGLVVDRLGPAGRVDLLSFPLLGLLSWNLLVYLGLAWQALRGEARAEAHEGAASRAAAGGGLAGLAAWSLDPARPWRSDRVDDGPAAVAALQRFGGDWLRLTLPLHAARLRRSLHLVALGVALGAVAGLYLRGLVLHYEASWSSTFLGATEVHGLLEALFAPAALVLGESLPDVAAIEALRGPEGAGDAALWIHLNAVTAALFIALPRGLLALLEGRRARRLARALPLDLEGDAYFLRLVAADMGEGRRAVVQAYSYRPSPRAGEGLMELLHDALGGRIEIAWLEPVEYGESLAAPDPEASEVCRVVAFSLAQTPEHEVHGALCAELARALEAAGGQRSLLVVLDRGPLEERLGREPEAAQRLERRERVWRTVLEEVGLDAVAARLDGGVDAAAVEAARVAVRQLAGRSA